MDNIVSRPVNVPRVEQTAKTRDHRREWLCRTADEGEEIPPLRYVAGKCPCGTVLSTYNQHTLCAICRTKALRANPYMDFKDRRPRDYGSTAVPAEYDELHQQLAGEKGSGGSAGAGA